MQIGSTRRRVSFLVLVFCYSRKLYVEFTLGQSMEQFLCAQQNGFRWIGGVTAEVMVDNCKTAVLDHPVGGPATLHPRYVDFAQHYGFSIKACTPRQPQQKGRVESAVAYIRCRSPKWTRVCSRKRIHLSGLVSLQAAGLGSAGRGVQMTTGWAVEKRKTLAPPRQPEGVSVGQGRIKLRQRP